ncbi:MAG TPA: Sua5 family C-terminal domain-containing protein, partial [Myxococcaceae bacterium]|nr:Sua5 family C-terminal domain-containing protein [Myxococcaceae bacterium]
LYTRLREADQHGHDVLVACLPRAEGLGLAVRDRLARAAAPRPDGDDAQEGERQPCLTPLEKVPPAPLAPRVKK